MIKYFFTIFFLLTIAASAAIVTLAPSTNLLVAGRELVISGTSAALESITVETNSFSISLASDSTLTLSSHDGVGYEISDSSNVVHAVVTCGIPSTLTLTATAGSTVTITPINTCTTTGTQKITTGSYPQRLTLPPVQTTVLECAPGDRFSAVTGKPCSIDTIVPAPASPPTTIPPTTFQFTRDLMSGMTHVDVKKLQQFLNTHGAVVATSGGGSLGHETTYFGEKTKQALIKYQELHAKDILTPLGLKKGTGKLGGKTRAYMNMFI